MCYVSLFKTRPPGGGVVGPACLQTPPVAGFNRSFNVHGGRWQALTEGLQPSTLACMAGSGFGRILSDKATSRWRGGPRSRHQLACMAVGWAVGRCHVSEEKATSRWRGGPRNMH
ncbi:hypothetical protein V6N13_035172 [Hibiscus sabdariffa]|uniref:Uncharacterized protein n=1 Tax=Hibiscus sabdariffa TaxID=183260 RepID=A0ABR2A1J5_9ROSI